MGILKSTCSDKIFHVPPAPMVNPNNLSYWHMGKCESEELNRTPHRVPLAEYCAGGGYYLNLESDRNIYA